MDPVGEELERLARLRASGDLTDGEFQILKARLIGTEPNAPAPSEQIPIPTTEEVKEDGVEDLVPVEDLLPVLEAARGELVGYEVTDWTSEEQAAFSEILTELGVSHEFGEEDDLVVSPTDEETVDHALGEFIARPVPRPEKRGCDEWVDPEDEAAKVAQDAALASLKAQRAKGGRLPALRFGSWILLSFNVFMAFLLVSGIIGATQGACAGLTGDDLDLCRAAAAIGTSIGVGIVLFVWAIIDVILFIVWFVTRSRQRSEPATVTRLLGLGIFVCAALLGVAALGSTISEREADPAPTRSPAATSRPPAATDAPTTATDAPTTAPKSTISQGFGSQDATKDLVAIDCGEEDILGFRYPSVTVKNNSSKPSSYWITIVVESMDGTVRYDDSFVIINSLGPGQTTTEEGLPFTTDLPSGSRCKITEVSRTAS